MYRLALREPCKSALQVRLNEIVRAAKCNHNPHPSCPQIVHTLLLVAYMAAAKKLKFAGLLCHHENGTALKSYFQNTK